MRATQRGCTALLIGAGALVVASPLPWFEARGFGVDASFSAMDTVALGTAAVACAAIYTVVALIIRSTSQQAWFLLTLCVGVFILFLTVVVFVSTEIIAGALPLPEQLKRSSPGPGPGLGFVLLSSVVVAVGSVMGLLARPSRPRGADTASNATSSLPRPDLQAPSARDDDAPAF